MALRGDPLLEALQEMQAHGVDRAPLDHEELAGCCRSPTWDVSSPRLRRSGRLAGHDDTAPAPAQAPTDDRADALRRQVEPALASSIARRLGIELGDVQLETFGNGEMYCRYGESIRGADVFIVQSGSPPVNDHVLELLVMINAARLASAHRITAVMPLFPYARQDKKSRRASRSALECSPTWCRRPVPIAC